jgi:hypothetical protein
MTRDLSLWGNLAGPPARLSPATSIRKGKAYDGWLKLRLCHAQGRTYFLPDVLIGFGETKFYLPSFFGPPLVRFNVPGAPGSRVKLHSATFSMDVAAPRGRKALRLEVSIRSDGHVLAYDDGAQLYRCTYAGPMNTPLTPLTAGSCSRLPDGDFALELFHHTTEEVVDKILSSGELWSGRYNLAGTSKLENVAYTYFTSLPDIRDDADLRRIAMSSGGVIAYQTTSGRPVEDVLDLPVYRSITADRTATLAFDIPCQIVAPAHLLFHPYVYPNPAYYEVVGSEIVRVAVNPGSKLAFVGKSVMVSTPDLKRFGYVVEGDASTRVGLEAPMREETTAQITHLEKLDQGLDIFEFWLKRRNTDQFTGRTFEARRLTRPS